MFNDDPMSVNLGLFHYPEEKFLRGFTTPPTTHYYRPFYNYFYEVGFALNLNS